MKYRIQKYNIFPSHLEDENSPSYAVERKKHWWSKWKSVYWTTDAVGNSIPKLVTRKEALEQFYRLTNTTCLQCRHCFGLPGESEWGFRRCGVRKENDGTHKVLYEEPYACNFFERRIYESK